MPPRRKVTNLISTLYNGNLEKSTELIMKMTKEEISQIDENGNTALNAALYNKYFDIALYIIKKISPKAINSQNKSGWTALMIAARVGHVEAVLALMSRMSDEAIALQNNTNGHTALMLAAWKDRVEIIRALVRRMSLEAIALQGNDGRNALMLAAWKGNVSAVRTLMEISEDYIVLLDKNGNTALMHAAWNGHIEVVQALMERMSDESIALQNMNGESALIWSSKNGHLEVVRALMERMSDEAIALQNKRGYTALIRGAEKGHVEVVRTLMERMSDEAIAMQNKDGRTAFMYAAWLGHAEVVRELMERMSDEAIVLKDKNGDTMLMLAAQNGHAEVVRALTESMSDGAIALQDEYGRTALMWAAREGSVEIVRALMERMADEAIELQDRDGYTALMFAARFGHVEVVRALMERMSSETIVRQDKYGFTALMLAAWHGCVEAVRALMERMTDEAIAMQNKDGRTAFMYAARLGHAEVVRELMERMSDEAIVLKDKNGDTMLMLAAQNGCVEVAQTLLLSGANTNDINNFGETALDIALENEKFDIAELLKQYGAISSYKKVEILDLMASIRQTYVMSYGRYFSAPTDISEDEIFARLSFSTNDYDISNTARLISKEIGVYVWNWMVFSTASHYKPSSFDANLKWVYGPLMTLLKRDVDSNGNSLLEIAAHTKNSKVVEVLQSLGYGGPIDKKTKITLAPEQAHADFSNFTIVKMYSTLKRDDPEKYRNLMEFNLIYSNFTVVATYLRHYLSDNKEFTVNRKQFWDDIVGARGGRRFVANPNSLMLEDCRDVAKDVRLRREIIEVYKALERDRLLGTDLERLVIHSYFDKLYRIARTCAFETYGELDVWRGYDVPLEQINLRVDSLYSFSFVRKVAEFFTEKDGFIMRVAIPQGVKFIPVLVCSLHDEHEIVLLERGNLKRGAGMKFDFEPSGLPNPPSVPYYSGGSPTSYGGIDKIIETYLTS